jgi:GAF domain-containing protein
MSAETKGTASEGREGRYYRALYDVAVSVNSSLKPQEVMSSIAESAARALEAKGASIMLLSPDHTELYHSAAHGLSDRYVRKGRLTVDGSMKESLAGRSVTIGDVANDPRVQYRPQAVDEGIASMLSVPVRLRGEVIGLIRLYSSTPREFEGSEIRFLEAVANIGAVALENARRFSEVRADYEGLQQDLLEWYATWGLERSADTLAGITPVRDEAA